MLKTFLLNFALSFKGLRKQNNKTARISGSHEPSANYNKGAHQSLVNAGPWEVIYILVQRGYLFF